jgi:uncharacterized protein (UPF0332 family)
LLADDLLASARKLANSSRGRPRQSDLRRAVSTAYYALFHAFAQDAANLLTGVGTNRAAKAWSQVYRSLEHGFAKNACKQVASLGFPQSLRHCADAFVRLQESRHKADYDPDERLDLVDVLFAIWLAENAISQLRSAERRDRRAFAVHLLLKKRTS